MGDSFHLAHLMPYTKFLTPPSWGDGPAFDDVFDTQTELAVLALQRNAALAETGYADAATREILHRHRCATPDGIGTRSADGHVEKFSYIGGTVNNSAPITWMLTNTDDGIALATMRSQVASAFSRWSAQTNLNFTQVTSGSATMMLSFGTPSTPDVDAEASGPAQGSDVVFNTQRIWSVSSPVTPEGTLDVQTVAMHEIGHALGLGHSSFSTATMWPFSTTGAQDRSLSADDNAAISVLYDSWMLRPGAARDIGVGGSGAVWAIGNVATAGGFSIHRWNGTSWDDIPGGAIRIAVGASGLPWVVNSSGQIFRRLSNNTWQLVPGCASDIAAGVSVNDVWSIACSGGIQKWNNATTSWVASNGVGTRIAVTSAGIPWVIQGNGNIFERSSSSATSGSWIQRTGCATDIGAFNHVWITTCTSTPGGKTLAIWMNQPLIVAGGQIRSPSTLQFRPVSPGGATNISVGPLGPWVTNSSLEIFQQHKAGTSGTDAGHFACSYPSSSVVDVHALAVRPAGLARETPRVFLRALLELQRRPHDLRVGQHELEPRIDQRKRLPWHRAQGLFDP